MSTPVSQGIIPVFTWKNVRRKQYQANVHLPNARRELFFSANSHSQRRGNRKANCAIPTHGSIASHWTEVVESSVYDT
jgi:hypothetical protein